MCPRVYAGLSDSSETVKIKGVKSPLEYNKLKSLLIKNSKLTVNQDKWYRNFNKGLITVIDELYTLMVTENKRKIIYDPVYIYFYRKYSELSHGFL